MAILDIIINGRTHQIACDDGQESHLRGLGKEIDARVQELNTSMGGKVTDGTLLALTSLMILDELAELKEQNRALKLQMGSHSQAFESAKQHEVDSAIAAVFDDVAERISQLTRTVSDKQIANA